MSWRAPFTISTRFLLFCINQIPISFIYFPEYHSDGNKLGLGFSDVKSDVLLNYYEIFLFSYYIVNIFYALFCCFLGHKPRAMTGILNPNKHFEIGSFSSSKSMEFVCARQEIYRTIIAHLELSGLFMTFDKLFMRLHNSRV